MVSWFCTHIKATNSILTLLSNLKYWKNVIEFESFYFIFFYLYWKMSAEEKRLRDSWDRKADWKNFGPYVSDRAWGTVREDYRYYYLFDF